MRGRVLAHQLLEVWPGPRSRASGDAPGASCPARPRRRPDAAPASGTRGARSACARPWRARRRRALITPAATARSSTRLRARRAASRIAVGAAHLRRLRQRDQQGRLGQRQPPRLLAEIGERGGAHAFEVAAERRQPQIEAQDRVLGQPPLQLRARAAPGGSCRRRCARARPAAGAPPAWSASSRPRRCAGGATSCQPARPNAPGVDAVMRAEALVLEGDQHGEIARVDILDLDRQPPAAVGAPCRRAAAGRCDRAP